MTSILTIARAWNDAGLSIFPVRTDGSKSPDIRQWKPYQTERASAEDINLWWGTKSPERGIGVIAGKISGNLEILDFDEPGLYEQYESLGKEQGVGDLIKHLPLVRTPSDGRHLYLRSTEPPLGNLKVAYNSNKEIRIETRGEGGYVLAPGSPAACHPEGKPYQFLRGRPKDIPTISAEERGILIALARTFNEWVAPEAVYTPAKHQGAATGTRPGDDFNKRGDVVALLVGSGWQVAGQRGETVMLRRPGKIGQGARSISATYNHGGSGLFHVFSSNAVPFDSEKAYSPFSVYAILKHGGDHKAAARSLGAEGYGEQKTAGRSAPRLLTQDGISHLLQDDSSQEGAAPNIPYRETERGLIWQKRTRDGVVDTPLANFTARILADITEDDGVEKRSRLEIEARCGKSTALFNLSAPLFAAMNWPVEQLGAAAFLYPGLLLKDHARVAIQMLSSGAPRRRDFSHTGWREIAPQKWAYLHAEGAIFSDGLACEEADSFQVSLSPSLSKFCLPLPPEGDQSVAAIRSSLKFFDLLPDALSFPLLCATYRSALDTSDFSVFLAGPSGVFKSEVAALCQQHFGPGLDARHLPAAWSSTDNFLEGLAFTAKDTILVVDDFAPNGTSMDVQRLHAKADRVLRGQGNNAARGRMQADGTLRAQRPPRGLILSTGEDVPQGVSLRGRMCILEVPPGAISPGALADCQKDAAAGQYAQAMAGFIAWLAPRYGEVKAGLRDEITRYRAEAATVHMHRRTPEITANLLAGLDYILQYAESNKAISKDEHKRFWERGWQALGVAAQAQQRHQAASEPTLRFLELITAALASGRCHVAGINGEVPQNPQQWGWRQVTVGSGEFAREEWQAQGERAGWVDWEDLLLQPDASFSIAKRMGYESGDGISIGAKTLTKRLKERNLLVSIEDGHGTNTVRKMINGARQTVLHLHTDSVLSEKSSQSSQSA